MQHEQEQKHRSTDKNKKQETEKKRRRRQAHTFTHVHMTKCFAFAFCMNKDIRTDKTRNNNITSNLTIFTFFCFVLFTITSHALALSGFFLRKQASRAYFVFLRLQTLFSLVFSAFFIHSSYSHHNTAHWKIGNAL